jgi:hypothetical protein
MSAWSRHHKQFTERRRRVNFSRNSARLSGSGPLLSGAMEGPGSGLQALQEAQGGAHEPGLDFTTQAAAVADERAAVAASNVPVVTTSAGSYTSRRDIGGQS